MKFTNNAQSGSDSPTEAKLSKLFNYKKKILLSIQKLKSVNLLLYIGRAGGSGMIES